MAQGRLVGSVALATLIVYSCVLSFFWNAEQDVPGSFAPAGWSTNTKLVMRDARAEFLNNQAQISDATLDQVSSAFQSSVLEDEPFTFAAFREIESGNDVKAGELLRTAILRNPRSREARVLLSDLRLREGEIAEAIAETELLIRLMPRQRRFFIGNLTYLASNPSTRDEALAAIKDEATQWQVLQGLAQAGASASMLIDTRRAFGQASPGTKRKSKIETLVSPLVRAGDVPGAKRLWDQFYDQSEESKTNLVADPSFSGELGGPFGWTVFGNRNGYARLSERGLIGEYYGRRSTRMARQLTLLPAGDYNLELKSGRVHRNVAIAIDCAGKERLETRNIDAMTVRFEFQIPEASCVTQEIWILGRASDPPKSEKLDLKSLTIQHSTI